MLFGANALLNLINQLGKRGFARHHVLLGLIWVQTVCKGSQQTTLVAQLSNDTGVRNRRKYKNYSVFFFSSVHVML